MIVKRSDKNPILKSDKKGVWQAQAVFNGCPAKTEEGVSLLYRAMSEKIFHDYAGTEMELSTIGIANSSEGVKFSKKKKLIFPENSWERFGCEDPRVTKLGDKYYIFYTALSQFPFNANGIKVAVAISKDLKKIDSKHPVTPFNAKAMALFPEKINNRMWTIFSYHTDQPPTHICLASLESEKDLWSEEFWNSWERNYEDYVLDLRRSERDHVEVGAPPIKTSKGWLLFYSYIKNYFGGGERVFSIEAVLLDLKNPLKIVARTNGPILVPEKDYELEGVVPNIVFPSGAMLNDNEIYLYYGGADTNCSLAKIDLPSLLDEMINSAKEFPIKRYKKNPILVPSENGWEKKAVLNPAAIYLDGKVHLVYRAVADDDKSVLGYAASSNGFDFNDRLSKPIYTPRDEFEETGCEDPRITKIDDTLYMLYTAFKSGLAPRVALTSIKEKDFLNKKWNWKKSVLISPPDVDDKDACLFPEKINGKYWIFNRLGHGIDLSSYSDLNFSKNKLLEENGWMEPRKGFWDSRKIGISCPPIKTDDGWVVIYHGISDDGHYHAGAFLLDLKNPRKILSRTSRPILSPETGYEKDGVVNNVVFPCGAVLMKDELYIYYGGADKVIGVATVKISDLMNELYACRIEDF